MIDGVNISNTGYGALGSYCIVFASLGSGVPFVRPGIRYEPQELIGTWRTSRGTATGGYTEVQFHVPNPAFGRVIAYQAPREVRIGARPLVGANRHEVVWPLWPLWPCHRVDSFEVKLDLP